MVTLPRKSKPGMKTIKEVVYLKKGVNPAEISNIKGHNLFWNNSHHHNCNVTRKKRGNTYKKHNLIAEKIDKMELRLGKTLKPD